MTQEFPRELGRMIAPLDAELKPVFEVDREWIQDQRDAQRIGHGISCREEPVGCVGGTVQGKIVCNLFRPLRDFVLIAQVGLAAVDNGGQHPSEQHSMFAPDPSPFAPIPGTTPSPRALFIKRWGTLTVPPKEGFASSPDDLAFYEGAVEALFRATRAGWRVYVVGNEEAVAFGHLAYADYERVQGAFVRHLERFGVTIERDYSCTDHPEGIKGRCNDSVYMLPNTGPFFHAAHNDGVDLRRSWVIGDETAALVAGWRAGLRTAAVSTGIGLSDGNYDVVPELHERDFASLIHELLAAQAASLR